MAQSTDTTGWGQQAIDRGHIADHVDSRVTCPQCITAETETWKRPGNHARPEFGHAMYFTHTGRVTACIARTLRRLGQRI